MAIKSEFGLVCSHDGLHKAVVVCRHLILVQSTAPSKVELSFEYVSVLISNCAEGLIEEGESLDKRDHLRSHLSQEMLHRFGKEALAS